VVPNFLIDLVYKYRTPPLAGKPTITVNGSASEPNPVSYEKIRYKEKNE
jgi:hypothetical protein